MRQLIRFLFSPKVFFNQLQWSKAHWFILGGFSIIALVESQTGHHPQFYALGSRLLHLNFGLEFGQSVWALTGLKLATTVGGAYLLSLFIWWLGGFVGEQGSSRVLFRRLLVVLTVFLVGISLRNLAYIHPSMAIVSSVLVLWSIFLGFYALQQQFQLGALQTVAMAAIVVVTMSMSIKFSNDVIEEVALSNGIHVPSAVTHRPSAPHILDLVQ